MQNISLKTYVLLCVTVASLVCLSPCVAGAAPDEPQELPSQKATERQFTTLSERLQEFMKTYEEAHRLMAERLDAFQKEVTEKNTEFSKKLRDIDKNTQHFEKKHDELHQKIAAQIQALTKTNNEQRRLQADTITQLQSKMTELAASLKKMNNDLVLSKKDSKEQSEALRREFEAGIEASRAAIQAEIKHRTLLFGILLTLVIGLGIPAFVLLLRKKSAEKLCAKILDGLARDTDQLSQFTEAILRQNQTAMSAAGKEPDHTLVKALGDRIAFMEVTLSRMDPKIKGHRQLVKMLSQMKDNLLVEGYELVDMLGKKYDSGMKVIANFVLDPSLAEGEQIITSVTKPQINYNGVMIQAAHITVSQNI